MPDMIQPVGAQIQPPDLGKALSPLSSVLGLRQQQQALQTGAYQQQTAQGSAQQSQQSMQERQAFQQAMQNGVDERGDSLYGDDPDSVTGKKEPDPMKVMAFAQRNMPLTGQAVIGSILKNQSDRIGLQSASADLSDKYRDDLSGIVRSGIQSGAKSQDLTGAVGQYVQLNPQAGKAAQYINSQLAHLDNAPNPQARDKMLNALAQQIQPSAATREQQGSPYGTATTVDTGGAIQPGVQAPAYEGGGFTASGKAVPKAPQQVTLPNQQVGNRDPRTGAVSVAPLEGGAGNANAAPSAPSTKLQPLTRPGANAPKADQDAYNAQIDSARQDVSGARNAANDPTNGVQSTRFRNQRIIDLIPHANTGPGSETLNNIVSQLPREFQTGDAYQDIEHYTAQNSSALAKIMGVPGTNLGAETAAAASGNAKKNPGALNEITKTNDALNTAFDLYNRGLQKLTNNGSDLSKVNSYKQAFGSNLDINAVRWADAHRRGDTQEINDLTKKLGADGIAKAKQSLKTLKSLSESGDLP
jgi:hypothetical protein